MRSTICKHHDKGNERKELAGGLFVGIELSKRTWKLAMTPAIGQRPRIKDVQADDLEGLLRELELAKERFGLAKDARVFSCFEAGRDGFWLHRWLVANGVENVVVDPASIEGSRRRRQAKTDRIDARKLVRTLIRQLEGEKVCSVVQVPSEADEDDRQLNRELEALKGERTRHRNRITSLLVERGFRVSVTRHFLTQLDQARSADGRSVSEALRERILREYRRLAIVLGQIAELESQRRAAKRGSEDPKIAKVVKLERLRAIGESASWLFVMEGFGWRTFNNRREVGSLIGLTPTPWDSGEMRREQGIDKAGNRRMRWMSIQIAWQWLRFQPNSELSKWYQRRFGKGSKRARKVGIVALARRLMIALWRYLEQDILPAGATLKA